MGVSRTKKHGKQLAPALMTPSGIRAIWRLLTDRKAPWGPKLLFFFAIAYVLMPLDLIPDMAPLITWLDDLGVMALTMGWLGASARRYAAQLPENASPAEAPSAPQ